MNDDRDSLGSHPLIARLLKGVYILRPPTPRYSSTWDVSKVTDYLRANVSKGQESPDRTKKSNSILFYQKIPLGG